MIWTFIAVGLSVLGIVCLVKEQDNFSDCILVIGIINLFTGIGIALFISIMAIYNHTSLDKKLYENNLQYESILKQVEVVNSEYEDVSKTDVIQKVYEWNRDVYSYKHWSESPWTNWLYSKKYADSLKYIEMEE